MKKFTKYLSAGLVILGLITPMATTTISSNPTVNASRYSHRHKHHIKRHRNHSTKLPSKIRRTWYGSYASKMAQISKMKLAGRPYVYNGPIREHVYKITRHGSHCYLYTESGNMSVWYDHGHLRCHLLGTHDIFNLYK